MSKLWLLLTLPLAAIVGCGARTNLRDVERVGAAPVEPFCGDHVRHDGEACDDGNDASTDACVACAFARCGDGVVFAGKEACDDGNTIDGDGCRNDCSLPSCGDGIVDPGEDCDDANGVDTDACPSTCLRAKCGDGFVEAGVEACDKGAENDDRPALLLTQGGVARPVRPIDRAGAAAAFYGYQSSSGHTGFEAVGASRMYLYRDTATGQVSLFIHHGIDLDATGASQPDAAVTMRFFRLPAPTFVSVSDDNANEFQKSATDTADGDWTFHDNTDGGVLSGFPFPGAWSIDVTATFSAGIASWAYVDGDKALVSLDLDAPANLTSQSTPSPCRIDCTVPRCGDGRLDAGEVCDDGNQLGGDGCAANCLSL